QAVSSAQAEMARRHEAGEMSYRMQADGFEGAYREMVEDTNELVGAQVELVGQMLDAMQRYAVGDLSHEMARLPGEKASITEAMDATRANLGAINGEIRRLVGAASQGDFSVRGDVDAFRHDFREMGAGMNRLMQDVEQTIDRVSAPLRSMAGGDLTARMSGNCCGVYARIRDDGNATVDRLLEIVANISDASQAINTA